VEFRYGKFSNLFGGESQAIFSRCRDFDCCHRGRRLADKGVHFHRVSVFVSDSSGRGLSSTMATTFFVGTRKLSSGRV
jgi:hypothetical protein